MLLEAIFKIGKPLSILFILNLINSIEASFITREPASHERKNVFFAVTMNDKERETKLERKRIACIGNSIQYFNDCPRLLERISNGKISHQDSCLRGGVSLVTILEQGNGMRNKFRTKNAIKQCTDGERNTIKYDIGSPSVKSLLCGSTGNINVNFNQVNCNLWDIVIMNDHTQSLARLSSRQEAIQTVLSEYVPFIRKCGAIPVLLMTAAYRREGIIGTKDLGTFEDFSGRVDEGYREMAEALAGVLPISQTPKVAPVGIAYQMARIENKGIWERLYHDDDFHPSPHGTFLQACVLHFTIFGCLPDESIILHMLEQDEKGSLNGGLWEHARMMQPENDRVQPKPNTKEAIFLLNIARKTCIEFNSSFEAQSNL